MFQRLMNFIRGFFGLFVSGLERSNPEALLEVEKERLREQIAKYNQGLATHAGLCERLMAHVRKLESEDTDLRARTVAHLKAGNREAAAQYALRLQAVVRELGDSRTQLEQGETTYQDLLKARDVSVQAARAKITALKAGLDDLRIKQATAELNEMAAGMISEIGGSGDTLDRLHEMIEEERTKAAGRARLARDSMSTKDVQLKEYEQKALADQALVEFATREGLALEPAPGALPASAPTKRLGPPSEG